jgi:PAS domain S-box-containing protein
MRPSKAIAKQVEVTALNIRERAARIHDGLAALHDLTLALLAATPHNADQIAAWFAAEGFEIDSHGYFERRQVLERARAGELDPGVHIYYANEALAANDEVRYRMFAQRGLSAALYGISRRLPEIAWFYYQDVTRYVIVYPMHDPCTVVPPDFDWHQYYTYRSVHPDVNPKREIRWTPPNIDYGGKGLMVAPSIPLYRGDELVGVWSFDVPVRALLRQALVDTVITGQQSFIVDREGALVSHDSLEAIAQPHSGDLYRKTLADLGGGFRTLDLAQLWREGGAQLVDETGKPLLAIAQPIPLLDWLLVATFPEQSVLQSAEKAFLTAFDRAKSGDLAFRLDDRDGDLHELAIGFNRMTEAVSSTIAEKEDALRRLEVSRDRARLLFEASPVGLAVAAPNGELLELNDRLREMLTYPKGALNPFNLLEAVLPSERKRVAALLKDAMRGEDLGPYETELQLDDRTLPVRIDSCRSEWDGRPALFLGVEDMTERLQLQARLLHTQKMQAIGKLAAGVAHDFNNLLTVIRFNVETLGYELAGDPKKQKLTEQIDLAAERAAALTSQLLTFSRQALVELRQVALSPVLGDAERLLTRLLEDNIELQLDIEVAGDEPEVRADPGQLLQVVMNMVINARDAIAGAGGKITIGLRYEREAERPFAVLTISDDGEGIDEQTAARIFDPFFTTKTHGSGLGLATVQDIVNAMEGTIQVDSEIGRGTSFTIKLPALAHVPAARRDDTGEWPQLRGAVLVVDDETAVRDAAAAALRREKIPVYAVSDGAAALELLRDNADIVAMVTDVVMPGMGGRELAERARELRPDLPVLFVSGYTDDTILLQGIAAEEVSPLRKPFSSRGLLGALHRLMNSD